MLAAIVSILASVKCKGSKGLPCIPGDSDEPMKVRAAGNKSPAGALRQEDAAVLVGVEAVEPAGRVQCNSQGSGCACEQDSQHTEGAGAESRDPRCLGPPRGATQDKRALQLSVSALHWVWQFKPCLALLHFTSECQSFAL